MLGYVEQENIFIASGPGIEKNRLNRENKDQYPHISKALHKFAHVHSSLII